MSRLAAERSIDAEALKLMGLFASVTRTSPLDVLATDDRIVFVVPSEEVGRAVGKGGTHLKLLRERLGKGVDVVGFDPDPAAFVKNIFRPYGAEEVTIEDRKDGTKVAKVRVPADAKGRAIGRNGKTVRTASELAKRNVGVDQVVVE